MMECVNAIAEWINSEIDRRHWSLRDVAKFGGVSHTTIVDLANGNRKATARTCAALARAFEVSEIEVIQRAMLFGSMHDRRTVYEVNETDLMLTLWHALAPVDRERVRDLMERLAQMPEARIIGEAPAETPAKESP